MMTVIGYSAPLTIRTNGISNIKMRASDIRKAELCATLDKSVNIESFSWSILIATYLNSRYSVLSRRG